MPIVYDCDDGHSTEKRYAVTVRNTQPRVLQRKEDRLMQDHALNHDGAHIIPPRLPDPAFIATDPPACIPDAGRVRPPAPRHTHNLFADCLDFENCAGCHDHAQDERHTQYCWAPRIALKEGVCAVNLTKGTCNVHGQLDVKRVFDHCEIKYVEVELV